MSETVNRLPYNSQWLIQATTRLENIANRFSLST